MGTVLAVGLALLIVAHVLINRRYPKAIYWLNTVAFGIGLTVLVFATWTSVRLLLGTAGKLVQAELSPIFMVIMVGIVGLYCWHEGKARWADIRRAQGR